MQKTDN